jgi:hypothetical protein
MNRAIERSSDPSRFPGLHPAILTLTERLSSLYTPALQDAITAGGHGITTGKCLRQCMPGDLLPIGSDDFDQKEWAQGSR